MKSLILRTSESTIKIDNIGADACIDVQSKPPALNLGGLISVIHRDFDCDAVKASGPIKIAADGTDFPAGYTGTDHVAVRFPDGTIYAAHSIGSPGDNTKPMTQQECVEACKNLSLLGLKWELASRGEAFAITDDTRCNPCVDTNLFPGIKPKWHWTRTAYVTEEYPAGSPSIAWDVDFSYGLVDADLRGDLGFAFAVSRPGQ